jgi:hypothetical protein
MAILYRIKPLDKKSIEAFYDVFSKDEQGNIRGWSVTETYRWGQGFVEDESELPFSDDREHIVDSEIGWGCELDDLCACWFEFDDSFTDEEKAEVYVKCAEAFLGDDETVDAEVFLNKASAFINESMEVGLTDRRVPSEESL